MSAFSWIVVLFLLYPIQTLLAQSADPVVLHHLTGPIHLDGLSFEEAWNPVEAFLPVQFEPDNGARPSERTEFLVAYDDQYIYFAIRAYDRDRDGLRINTLYRDRLSGDDHFEVLLDTYNDNETAVLFTTNPGALRKDATISNDASGGGIASGGWINGNFNTYWDVEATINDDGWFAEMRIPFSSLQFQVVNDKVVMGITFQRKIARRTERLVFPPIPPIASWAFLKPSLAQKIELEGVYPSKPVYVTPYGLSGVGQTFELNKKGTGYGRMDDWKREIGADLKYGLTNNLTMDLSVNTDFAQVEADDQQVNLTRFSLFYPEKRQFFQERSSIFDFRTGGLSRLFHSRRIGLTDTGQPVRILGGARIVGRMGVWDVGFLDMQTADTEALPSENFGVLRVRRQVFNPYSYAGGMATTRIGTDGSYNVAYGLDTIIRVFGDDYLTLQWAQSFDQAQIEADTSNHLNSGRFTAEMTRRRRRGLGYSSVVAWAGADYNPGLGFTQRNDFTLLDETLEYSWLPGSSSALIWHTLGVSGFAFVRNPDQSIESAEVGPQWSYAAKNGTGGSLQAKLHYEDLPFDFPLSSDATVPKGSYTFYQVGASYSMSHTDLRQISVHANVGSFYDGWRAMIYLRPTWYVSQHLELSGSYQYNRVRFPDRDEEFDAHIARLRIGTALNTEVSTNAFIQYNSAFRALSANIRFRYNFREGNDFWIVYSEGLNTDRDRIRPTLPVTDNRTVLVKYTYTFAL